jgi:hypothetical protein
VNVQAILDELARHGVRLRAENGRIIAKPLGAVPYDLAHAVRAHKREVLALLGTDSSTVRPARTRSAARDSRHPLIPPEVRTKIEAIERDARRMGWPPESLWNGEFWGVSLDAR